MAATADDVQPQNQNSKFIGTGEFRFAEGFLTAVAALGKAFIDFGNISATQYQTNSDSKVIISSRRGIRKEEGTRVTLLRFGYKLKCSEFRTELQRYLISGDPDPAGNYTQAVKAAVAADAIAAPVKYRWYDLTIAGVEYRNLTTVAVVPAAGSLTEDVDYKIDYENGAMRWITTPVTLTAINLTCPAILVTDALSLRQSVPMVTPIRRGIGRLQLYDRIGAVQNTVYQHRDFYCEVMATGSPNIDGQNEAELDIDVKVLSPSGKVRHREDATYAS